MFYAGLTSTISRNNCKETKKISSTISSLADCHHRGNLLRNYYRIKHVLPWLGPWVLPFVAAAISSHETFFRRSSGGIYLDLLINMKVISKQADRMKEDIWHKTSLLNNTKQS
jgi:hypothetical protein